MRARQRHSVWMVATPVMAFGIAVFVGSLLAFLGEWWWAFDAVANFRAQLLGLGMLVFVGGAVLGVRSVMLVGILASVVNVLPIVPLYTSGGPAAGEPDLRLATYNLLHSASSDAEPTMEWLDSIDADVVILHEVGPGWRAALRQADLGLRVEFPERPSGGWDTVALVRDGAVVDYIDLIGRITPVVTVDVGGEDVSVLGVHTVSPYGPGDTAQRDDELLAIAEWAVEHPGPLIVAGDLNATPFSWSFQRMLEVSGLENSMNGFGLQNSWPSTNPFLRIPIDHVLVTDDLDVVDRRVLGSLGSDHFPIEVDLAFAGPGA